MTMMIEHVNTNSPAQAVKSRARGPTITQLRAKQAALVAASELARRGFECCRGECGKALAR